MKKHITLKEIMENEELLDCVLKKACFYYILEHPEEHIRLNNISLKRLKRPLEYKISKSCKYRIIVE